MGIFSKIKHVVERAVKSPISIAKDVVHGDLRAVARDATNSDPLKIIPDGIQKYTDKAIPIALNFIPGVGTLAAAGYTAAKAYGDGSSLGSSLLQGGGSLASAYGGSALGGALAAPLGTSAANASGLAGAAIGAGFSKLQGQNPLLGAIGGGIGAYARTNSLGTGLSGGDSLPGSGGTVGNGTVTSAPLASSGLGQVADAGTGAAGSSYGGGGYLDKLKDDTFAPFLNANSSAGTATAAASAAPANNFDSILRTTNGASDVATKSSGGLSDLFSTKSLSPLLSAGLGAYTNSANKADLLKANAANSALLTPFTTASFNPGDLTQDPGYQFQLQQGTDALNRKQAASGNYFSGEALQAAQDYGQGLAGTTYNDAYGRFLQQNQQQLAAAGALATNNSDAGNIKAAARTGTNNVLAGAGGALLGGQSFGTNGQSLGIGNLLGGSGIGGLTPEQLALYLKQQQGVSSYGRT